MYRTVDADSFMANVCFSVFFGRVSYNSFGDYIADMCDMCFPNSVLIISVRFDGERFFLSMVVYRFHIGYAAARGEMLISLLQYC